jgi:hypothetical protein
MFEPKRGALFELSGKGARRGLNDPAGVAVRVERQGRETRAEWIHGEARADQMFEPKRGRRAAGEEHDEARADQMFEPKRGRRAAGEEHGEARAE